MNYGELSIEAIKIIINNAIVTASLFLFAMGYAFKYLSKVIENIRKMINFDGS